MFVCGNSVIAFVRTLGDGEGGGEQVCAPYHVQDVSLESMSCDGVTGIA